MRRDYRADVIEDNLRLAKTSVTYLSFKDFDTEEFDDLRRMRSFMKEYKFLRYCIECWDYHARFKEGDESLLNYVQKFLSSKRSNNYLNLIAWMVLIESEVKSGEDNDNHNEREVNWKAAFSLLPKWTDMSPLHWAAMVALPSLCQRLISQGYDVNQGNSFCGTPLLAAVSDLFTLLPFSGRGHLDMPLITAINKKCVSETVRVLIVSLSKSLIS